MAHVGRWQGRRARYLGPRKNLFDLLHHLMSDGDDGAEAP
jgi:hypothetical protein